MYADLQRAIEISKVLNLGFRTYAPNDWDRLSKMVDEARTIEEAAA